MIPAWLPVAVLFTPVVLSACAWVAPKAAGVWCRWLAIVSMAAATVACCWLAGVLLPGSGSWQSSRLTWLDLGSWSIGLGLFLDPMGIVLAAIVCGLATLVLVATTWYLHDDAQEDRFTWQFCLFCAAMLGVVMSDSLLMSFLCWELVGLGSYLLIGFWFAKPAVADDPDYQRLKGAGARGILEDRLSPGHAQLKAFVMNRVGDAGFLIGIGALLAAALSVPGHAHDPLTWSALFQLAQGGTLPGGLFGLSGETLLTIAGLGIFCGAVGKSAQFPLHTWLPDAMQGPTTASSIIHAATMVAAGVFLVARAFPLFSPDALSVVGWTGGVTCLLAAGIACVQWDLKAVLAYSTISQLGLMFVALGAGNSAAAITHLFTHAIFKCLLFLCAAAVIHATHGCQDLARLGGLGRRMPVTAFASLAAVLAIAGMPLFSGFVSKDGVLAAAIASHTWGPLLLAATASLLTSAYMLRWWLRIFTGASRDAHLCSHAHDPWPRVLVVFVLLAIGCFSLPWTVDGWLEHALAAPHDAHAHHQAMLLALTLLSLGGGFSVVVFWWLPARGIDAGAVLARKFAPLHAAAGELWGIDRLWDLLFVRGLGLGGGRALARFDLGGPGRLAAVEDGGGNRSWSLDGCIDALGRLCGGLGSLTSHGHDGRLGLYVVICVVLGAAALLLGVLW